jgi:hypothetical protein
MTENLMEELGLSTVERVSYRGKRETSTHILTADNMSIREDKETGALILELFRYNAKGDPVEGWQMRFCTEDRKRLRQMA